MANSFYTNTYLGANGRKARRDHINAQFDDIEAGFDAFENTYIGRTLRGDVGNSDPLTELTSASNRANRYLAFYDSPVGSQTHTEGDVRVVQLANPATLIDPQYAIVDLALGPHTGTSFATHGMTLNLGPPQMRVVSDELLFEHAASEYDSDHLVILLHGRLNTATQGITFTMKWEYSTDGVAWNDLDIGATSGHEYLPDGGAGASTCQYRKSFLIPAGQKPFTTPFWLRLRTKVSSGTITFDDFRAIIMGVEQ